MVVVITMLIAIEPAIDVLVLPVPELAVASKSWVLPRPPVISASTARPLPVRLEVPVVAVLVTSARLIATAAPTPTLLDPPEDPPLLPEDGLPTALASAVALASVCAELRTVIAPPATMVQAVGDPGLGAGEGEVDRDGRGDLDALAVGLGLGGAVAGVGGAGPIGVRGRVGVVALAGDLLVDAVARAGRARSRPRRGHRRPRPWSRSTVVEEPSACTVTPCGGAGAGVGVAGQPGLDGVLGVAEAQRDADRGVVALGVALALGGGRGGLGGGDVDRTGVVDPGCRRPDIGLGEHEVDRDARCRG